MKILIPITLLLLHLIPPTTSQTCQCPCTPPSPTPPPKTPNPQNTTTKNLTLPTPNLPPLPQIPISDACTFTTDCPSNTFCNQTSTETFSCFLQGCPTIPNTCLPKLSINTSCTVGADSCDEGLYCGPEPFQSETFEPVCRAIVGVGERCDVSSGIECENDGVCLDGVCGGRRGEGGVCGRDVECGEGVFCEFNEGVVGGVCRVKKGEGEVCGVGSSNGECVGWCNEGGTKGFGGVCVERFGVGGRCKDNLNCGDGLVCVGGRRDASSGGVCVERKDVLRKVGLDCDLEKDLCDENLALRCGILDGKSVCLQGIVGGQSLGFQCSPGSKFSTCETELVGAPVECRQSIAFYTKIPFGNTVCSQRREIVKKKMLCSSVSFAICEQGTSCEEARGVQSQDDRGSTNQVRYCMEVVKVGSSCDDTKFDTACEEGSFCIDNVCTAVSTAPEIPVLFSGLGADCTSTECAPGLVCEATSTSPITKACSKMSVQVGQDEPCFENATTFKECTEGLQCVRRRDANGDVIKRCSLPASEGQFCENDKTCAGDLKCRAGDGTLAVSKCVDPSKLLARGASCDPDNDQCGIEDFIELKCLEKTSQGSFACQTQATLYQFCSPSENIGCAKGLMCGEKSLCVPT